MKKYYAAENYYGSDTSVGGYNTWFVVAFTSKQARDKWVDDQEPMSARAIRRVEVTKYQTQGGCKEPMRFTDQYWGFRNILEYTDQHPDGYIGHLEVCDTTFYQGERLYK